MSWDVLRLVNLILVCLGTLKEHRTCHGNPRHLCQKRDYNSQLYRPYQKNILSVNTTIIIRVNLSNIVPL